MWIPAIIYICAWLQPLHFLPWVSWHNEALAFFSILIAVFFLIFNNIFSKNKKSIEIPNVALLMLMILGVAIFQFLIGDIIYFGDFLSIFLYVILCVISATVGRCDWRSDKSTNYLLYFPTVILVCAISSAFFSIAQFFDVWNSFDFLNPMNARRPGANIGQPNHLATLLLMGLASIYILYELRRVNLIVAAIIATLLLFSLALTESRTGILGLVLLFSLLGIKQRKLNGVLSKSFFVIVFCLFFILFFSIPKLFISFYFHDENLGFTNFTTSGRDVIWIQMLDAISLKPFFGWGFLQVSKAHNEVVFYYDSSIPFTYSHNIVMDLFLSVGIPLGMVISIGVIAWIVKIFKSINSLEKIYYFSIVMVFLWHSMFEFPYAYAYFIVPVFIAIGRLEFLSGGKAIIFLKNIPALIIISMISILCIVSVAEYVKIEEDFRIARFEALKTGKTPEDYMRPKIYLFTQLDALLKASRINPTPEMSEKDIIFMRNVAMRYPWSAIQYRYALSLALNNRYEDSRKELLVIKKMHGDFHFNEIKENFNILAYEKYPQIKNINMP